MGSSVWERNRRVSNLCIFFFGVCGRAWVVVWPESCGIFRCWPLSDSKAVIANLLFFFCLKMVCKSSFSHLKTKTGKAIIFQRFFSYFFLEWNLNFSRAEFEETSFVSPSPFFSEESDWLTFHLIPPSFVPLSFQVLCEFKRRYPTFDFANVRQVIFFKKNRKFRLANWSLLPYQKSSFCPGMTAMLHYRQLFSKFAWASETVSDSVLVERGRRRKGLLSIFGGVPRTRPTGQRSQAKQVRQQKKLTGPTFGAKDTEKFYLRLRSPFSPRNCFIRWESQ